MKIELKPNDSYINTKKKLLKHFSNPCLESFLNDPNSWIYKDGPMWCIKVNEKDEKEK